MLIQKLIKQFQNFKLSTKKILPVAFLIVALASVAGWYFFIPRSSAFCFINQGKLACMSINKNQTSFYKLPTIKGRSIKALVPAPDQSTYLAFVDTGPYTGNQEVWLLNKKMKPIFNSGMFLHPFDMVYQARWSPDKKYIYVKDYYASLYRYNTKSNKNERIVINKEATNLDRSDELRLSVDGFEVLSDGRLIVRSGANGNSDHDVYIINSDGSNPQKITSQANSYTYAEGSGQRFGYSSLVKKIPSSLTTLTTLGAQNKTFTVGKASMAAMNNNNFEIYNINTGKLVNSQTYFNYDLVNNPGFSDPSNDEHSYDAWTGDIGRIVGNLKIPYTMHTVKAN
jgi:hypothetical protein